MKVFEILAALSLSYLFINALSEIKHRLKKSLPGAKQTIPVFTSKDLPIAKKHAAYTACFFTFTGAQGKRQ